MRIVSLFIIGLFFTGHVQAKVTEFQLENGLKIIVKEDHRAPVVVQQIWYRVGSNHEHSGITGLSHMLEHLMFKGTETLDSGGFSEKIAQLGGQENGFTSSDYTVYFQVIGNQHLKTMMKLEADRMHNLVLTEAEFLKEREVVKEERRWRVEDRPISQLYEQFRAVAFLNSPSRQPVIGWMEDIESWNLQDLKKWYEKWYAPNNATLVVVGSVDPQEVYKWAKLYYGVHPFREVIAPKPQVEIKQRGERRITVLGATKSPFLLMGFHVPTLVTASTPEETKEVYALSVLSSVLDGDDSARLTRNLVKDKETLAGVGASFDGTDRLKTLFLLQAKPSKGITTQQVEKELWAEIKALQKTLVSQQELNRVLAQAEAQYVFHQDSIRSQARVLGSLVSVGLPASTAEDWVKNLRKVTPEQIQAVAKKYFQPDKVTVGILLPSDELVKKYISQTLNSAETR